MWRYAGLIILLLALAAQAHELQVKMLAQGSALIEINGKPRMLRNGATSPEGVKLVSADGKQAVVEVNGQRQTLTLNRLISTRFQKTEQTEVRIASGRGGHYYTPGRINGMPVEFVVDTGATGVSMNRLEAERLGIDYRAGVPVMVGTANGTVKKYQVVLDRVAVGDIELRQVAAVVSSTESPTVILLGNTFLSQLEISIDQGVLLLRKKH